VARAIAVRAGGRPGEIPTHLGAGFVDLAIAAFPEMPASEQFLFLKHAERNEHLGDRIDVGDEGGGCGIFLPARVFFFHFFVGMLERETAAAVARAAGPGIGGAVRRGVNGHEGMVS